MATQTTNLGLTKPAGTDNALVSVFNTNSDLIDGAFGKANGAMGIYITGDTAPVAIAAGAFVIWKGDPYTARSAIAIGDTLSATNLKAESNGGFNALKDELGNAEDAFAIVVNGDNAPQAISSGQYLFIKNHSTLANGGYHATAAISSGAAITSSNVAADADGIANSLYSKIAPFDGKSVTDNTSSTAMGNNDNIPTNRTVRNAIYNGLDKSSGAGYMLDARQGKALNDKFGSSAKTITKASNIASAGTINCRSNGSIAAAVCSLPFTGSTSTTWVTIGTLPSDLTPTMEQLFLLMDDSTFSSGRGYAAEGKVTSGGNLQLYAPQNGHTYWGGFMWLIA